MACPFCRVMLSDGVDDVAAAQDVPKAEVLDVAQLLLNSLDTSSVTLPEKGTAAKEAEQAAQQRAARVEASAPTVEAEPEAEEEPAAQATTDTKPVTGLGIAGGASVLAPRRLPPLTQPRPTKSPRRQRHPSRASASREAPNVPAPRKPPRPPLPKLLPLRQSRPPSPR